MIQIETLIRKHLPKLCKNYTLSTLCLCTSNPTYLIFIDNSHTPDLVVRLSQSEDICHVHQITKRLHEIMGNLIPEPLLLLKDNGQNISIQKGVNGQPWFQLSEKYASAAKIEKIHTRAIEALNQLHHTIASSSDWTTSIQLGDTLRKRYQQCINSGVALPAETETLVEQFSKSLDEVGELSTFPQHGDFCLNNLIFGEKETHIIDFEDFGVSAMPFHDQFTLALSFHQLSLRSSRITLENAINNCISKTLIQPGLVTSHLPGLFLHHLLLRLGTWSQDRLEYRQWLLSILENFINSPNALFQDINID